MEAFLFGFNFVFILQAKDVNGIASSVNDFYFEA
jgi:hypothetical protein